MASEKQVEANRRNAQKSTGPRTREGKARSRCNAATHGATAKSMLLLPGEDPKVFQSCMRAVHEAFQPVGAYEYALVQRIAGMEWRLTRLFRFETGVLHAGLLEITETERAPDNDADNDDCDRSLGQALESKLHQLNLFARYEASLQRTLERTCRMLERVRKLRLGGSPHASASCDGWKGFLDPADAEAARLGAQEVEDFIAAANERRRRANGGSPGPGGRTSHPKTHPRPDATPPRKDTSGADCANIEPSNVPRELKPGDRYSTGEEGGGST